MNPVNIEYRLASEEDAHVIALMNKALIQDENHRNPMTPMELEKRMTHWLSSDYQSVLFENDGKAVGYALFRDEDDYVYLRQFFVQSEFRRQGVGQAAVGWLRENAWSSDRPVRIEVLVDNVAAIRFWRAVGFKDYCLTMET